jgi:osmotically inducible protein OsmC
MAQIRRAQATWSGDLAGGGGDVRAGTSGTFGPLPITWRARAEADDTGQTSPEELLAAAHASCYAMASSNNLAKAGYKPDSVEVTVDVTADKRDAGWTVISSAITVRARVPGIDEAAFREAVEGAKAGCPISRAIAGNVEITLDAQLIS